MVSTTASTPRLIDIWNQGKTFADGVFRLPGADPGKTYRIHFIQPEREIAAVVDLKADPQAKDPIEVKLETCAKVHGKLVTAGGSPVREGQVYPSIVIGGKEGEMSRNEVFRNTHIYSNILGQKAMLAYGEKCKLGPPRRIRDRYADAWRALLRDGRVGEPGSDGSVCHRSSRARTTTWGRSPSKSGSHEHRQGRQSEFSSVTSALRYNCQTRTMPARLEGDRRETNDPGSVLGLDGEPAAGPTCRSARSGPNVPLPMGPGFARLEPKSLPGYETDAQGAFSLTAEHDPNRYQIQNGGGRHAAARRPGAGMRVQTLTPEMAQITLRLAPEMVIHGRLLTPTGLPACGCASHA